MEEVMKLFAEYEPIKSIYENDGEYICFPERKDLEPLAIFYDKSLNQYKELYFYEDMDDSIADAVENGQLIYGEPLKFND